MKTLKSIQIFLYEFTGAVLILTTLVACNPSKMDLSSVHYAPLVREEWPVSTPEDQGIDSRLVTKMYQNAAELETLYSLLVIKDGYLIAEDYFN